MPEPVKKVPQSNGRKPVAKQERASRIVKRLHRARPAEERTSLKAFMRTLLESEDAEVKKLAKRWLHNKRANASNPPLGLGRTRKYKNKGGGGGKKQ